MADDRQQPHFAEQNGSSMDRTLTRQPGNDWAALGAAATGLKPH